MYCEILHIGKLYRIYLYDLPEDINIKNRVRINIFEAIEYIDNMLSLITNK